MATDPNPDFITPTGDHAPVTDRLPGNPVGLRRRGGPPAPFDHRDPPGGPARPGDRVLLCAEAAGAGRGYVRVRVTAAEDPLLAGAVVAPGAGPTPAGLADGTR